MKAPVNSGSSPAPGAVSTSPAAPGPPDHRSSRARTFLAAASRYWTSVHPQACDELAGWHRRALSISDPELRRIALAGLAKHSNVEGAVVFATFVPARERAFVIRASAAFQAAYDYLDVLTECRQANAVRKSREMHTALLAALRLDAGEDGGVSWRHACAFPQAVGSHELPAWRRGLGVDDGGYLEAMVEACRTALAALPSYPLAEEHALRGAERVVGFQSFNCGVEQGDEDALARWAVELTTPRCRFSWWELAASAGSSLGVLATIAAAADPLLDEEILHAIEHAYHPAIGALHSLLDQLVDLEEDEANGQLNLLRHYSEDKDVARALGCLAARARLSVEELERSSSGIDHALVVAAMAASYLSLPQASLPRAAAARAAVLAELGPLAAASIAVFEARRDVARR